MCILVTLYMNKHWLRFLYEWHGQLGTCWAALNSTLISCPLLLETLNSSVSINWNFTSPRAVSVRIFD